MNERTEIPPISELYSVVTGCHHYLDDYDGNHEGIGNYDNENYVEQQLKEIPECYESHLGSPSKILSLDPPSFPTKGDVSGSLHIYSNVEQNDYFQDHQQPCDADEDTPVEPFYVHPIPAPPPYPTYSQHLPIVSPDQHPQENDSRELYYYYTTNAFPVQELLPSNKYGQRYSKTPSPDPVQVFEVSSHIRSHSTDTDESCFETNKKPTNSKKTRRRVPTVAQRKAANIRERRRMFNLNGAFDILRKTVPTFAYEKHLSRIETLRLAIGYICFMKDLLEIPTAEAHRKYANAPQEMSLKWSVQL